MTTPRHHRAAALHGALGVVHAALAERQNDPLVRDVLLLLAARHATQGALLASDVGSADVRRLVATAVDAIHAVTALWWAARPTSRGRGVSGASFALSVVAAVVDSGIEAPRRGDVTRRHDAPCVAVRGCLDD